MNLKVTEEIVRAMRIGDMPCDCKERISRIRPGHWEGALSWLRRSGLALYWWSRIRSGQAESAVPETIRGRLDDDLQENRARLAAMAEEFRTLLRLIEDAGIPYVVLNGFVIR
jgi:putative nucleotidyltransferase-like protein